MKKKFLLALTSMVLSISLIACGQTEVIEEIPSESSEEVVVTSEVNEEAMAIIENAEQYNTTDNLFAWEDYAGNRTTLFVNEENSEGYAMILDELEEKTGSAQEQVVDFYNNVSIMFPTDSDVYDGANHISQVFYYYDNIMVNSSWAVEDIRFNATVSGGNEVNTESGWTPPHFASGETIYLADATIYMPYYIAECSANDKIPSMNDMINEMCALNRSDTFLLNFRSSENTDGNPNNEIFSDYEYEYAIQYAPFYETLADMGVAYDDFSELSNQELVFSASINVSTDYYSNDSAICTYIIPFWDKTANVYGEALYTAENRLIGIRFSDADIEAMKIITYARGFNVEYNLYESDYVKENPQMFFLDENSIGSYNLILEDLDRQTDSSRNTVLNFYNNLDSIYSEENELLELVHSYYANIATDSALAQANMDMPTGYYYADGEEILVKHLIIYMPYYLSEDHDGKEYTLSAIFDELGTFNKMDIFIGHISSYDANSLIEYVPYYSTMIRFAMCYSDFSTLSESEIIFSSPIMVTNDYWWFEHFYGRVESEYIVNFYDKTIDCYGEIAFTSENKPFEICYFVN